MPTTKKPAAPKKSAAKKTSAHPAGHPAATHPAAKKPAVHKEEAAATEAVVETQHEETAPKHADLPKGGKYFYAVGRRKTSVANIRMFTGHSKSLVNHKEIEKYFGNQSYVDQAFKPLQLTGLEKQVYVYVNVSGGGTNSQSQAIAHGIATAVATGIPDFRKVLKKNGLLTRDSRMKERKKPGLKRARRGPQWAKR